MAEKSGLVGDLNPLRRMLTADGAPEAKHAPEPVSVALGRQETAACPKVLHSGVYPNAGFIPL